jgi:hypothetical protein
MKGARAHRIKSEFLDITYSTILVRAYLSIHPVFFSRMTGGKDSPPLVIYNLERSFADRPYSAKNTRVWREKGGRRAEPKLWIITQES